MISPVSANGIAEVWQQCRAKRTRLHNHACRCEPAPIVAAPVPSGMVWDEYTNLPEVN